MRTYQFKWDSISPIKVTYKGSLTNNHQYYSLILSGQQLISPAIGDFNCDGKVDYFDLGQLLLYWLMAEPSVDIAPLGGDNFINLLDYSTLSGNFSP